MSSTSFDLPERPGSEWFLDEEGVPTTSKHRDELLPIIIDLGQHRAILGGATISSASWKDQGVTTSSRTTTSSTVTANVLGSDGAFTVTITLSTGEKVVRTRRFLGVADGRRKETDYP